MADPARGGGGVDVGTPAWWDEYFAVGGGWESNDGRMQTRVFAETFCRHIDLEPLASFTLLDVGCALGDALRVFAVKAPRAQLFGIDISRTAIDRCRAECEVPATFTVGSIEGLTGSYDVIYASNVLEHFADYVDKVRLLAQRCERLFVMVPHEERRDGAPLVPDGRNHHQHTFDESSFDFLVDEGVARSVSATVTPCPGAWGWSRRRRVTETPKNLGRRLRGRPVRTTPKQVIFDISTTNVPGR